MTFALCLAYCREQARWRCTIVPFPRAVLLGALLVILTACNALVDEEPTASPEPDDIPTGAAPTPEADPTPEPQPTPDEAARLAWVGVEGGGEFVLIDLDLAEVIERHDTPRGPHNVTVADDGTAAGALYRGTQLVLVRDGETTFVELGATPHDVKATAGLFVVANEAGERLDLVSIDGEHVDSIPIRGQPHDVAIAPDGVTAWVTINHTDQLAVVDLEQRQVVEHVPTGQSPHDILIGPDGRIWVTDWRGPVHAFDPDGQLLETMPVGEEAHHLAFTPDGDELWVTDHHTNEVIVIDAHAYEVLGRMRMPGSPHHVHITPDGKLAAVADHTNGTVVVFDVETRDEVTTIEVGSGPHGVWTVPAGPAGRRSHPGEASGFAGRRPAEASLARQRSDVARSALAVN